MLLHDSLNLSLPAAPPRDASPFVNAAVPALSSKTKWTRKQTIAQLRKSMKSMKKFKTFKAWRIHTNLHILWGTETYSKEDLILTERLKTVET